MRTRTEDDHPRVVGGAWRDRLQRVQERAEEAVQGVRGGPPEHVRRHPGHHPAVGHRIPSTGGRLGAVADGEELPRRRTEDVGGVEEQLVRAGDGQPVRGPEVGRAAEDQLGRDEAAADQRPRAVEVGQDQVEQGGPLPERRIQPAPVVTAENERHGVQLPPLAGHRARGQGFRPARILAVGRGSRWRRMRADVADRVVGDAVVVEHPVDLAAQTTQARRAQFGESGSHLVPGRPHRPVGVQHLVEPRGPPVDRSPA